jgi:PAS domain S-box-containing protein
MAAAIFPAPKANGSKAMGSAEQQPMRRHRLLERQIKSASRDTPDGTPDLETLLDLVSQAYVEQEDQLRHDNAAVALVSRQIAELNLQLREEAAARTRDATRLTGLLENASEAILMGTSDGTIVTFNRAAEQMFGYAAQEMIGEKAHCLFGDGVEDLHDQIQTRLKTTEDTHIVRGSEVTALRKGGERFAAEYSLTRLKFEGEEHVVGFWRDLSAQKAAQTALMAAKEEAEAANGAKSEFLAAMSHEIRTPMNGVLGMVAALDGTPLTDEQRRMLAIINESGQVLMTLLSDILDLSKIEAGRMVFENTRFDASASIHAVAGLYAETAASKTLDYHIEIEESARGWFVGDPTRYRQVLQNLVANALKFTEAGQVEIRASCEAGPAGGVMLRTEVIDTGVGISRDARAKLFQKFSQADASTTRRYGGTGLGLAISRQLVEALGGEIGVESQPGLGSRFWFALPLQRTEAPLQADEQAPAGREARSSRVRILAAEDNETNQLVLKALLSQADVQVAFADNGAEALEAARENDFDLVLMDVQMPVMDGMTAARAIRALAGPRSTVPIVAVTADAMPEQVAMCLNAGMDAHISKPLRPEALFSVIDECLRRPRAFEPEPAEPARARG